MNGKVLGITGNDLYGNVDDRNVSVFACFTHTKYMNNYVIFAIKGEYNKKKLLYGSVHIKDNSIVVFNIKDHDKPYIESFLSEYLSDNLKEFNIIDISNKEKIELVSYNEMDYDDLEVLDKKSIYIPEIQVIKEEPKKSKIGLWILLVLLILLGTGLTIIYFNPSIMYKKYTNLNCTSDKIFMDSDLDREYKIIKEVRFDENELVKNIIVTKEYYFSEEEYTSFKEQYSSNENFIFDDENLVVRLDYIEDTIMSEYNEIYKYMRREGFSCIRGEYEE